MAMSLTTPRSALRTINEDQDTIRSLKNKQPIKPGTLAPTSSLFKKPLQTLSKGNDSKTQLRIHTDEVCKQKVKTKEEVITRPPEPFPEKEKLNIFNPAEDLKPKIDKALLGVVEKIRNWRPPCMFGAGAPDSDDSFEEDDWASRHRNFPIAPPPTEEPLADLELEVPEFDIQDMLPVPSVDIEDLPIPFLDDSLDIEPNMGTLEIWGSSTPASMSPKSPVSPSNQSYLDISCKT